MLLHVSTGGGRRRELAYLRLKNDGRRYCWGSNADGQLGLGDTTNRTVPTAF